MTVYHGGYAPVEDPDNVVHLYLLNKLKDYGDVQLFLTNHDGYENHVYELLNVHSTY